MTELGRTYGKGASAHHDLADINLTIRGNEFFGLLRPSGCGKTTLFAADRGV